MALVRSRDGRFDLRRIDVEVVGCTSTRTGSGVEIAHHLGRGGKGVGRGDHLVALLQADGFQGQVHGRRAGVDGDGVFGAHGGGKLGLELARLGAGGDPAGFERFVDLLEFGRVDVG